MTSAIDEPWGGKEEVERNEEVGSTAAAVTALRSSVSQSLHGELTIAGLRGEGRTADRAGIV